MTHDEQIIQNEYEFVTSRGIPFEMVMVDSFNHLRYAGLLVPSRDEIIEAESFVKMYRRIVKRSGYRLQEEIRSPDYQGNSKEENERIERDFQHTLTKKLLLSNWYFKQREAGVNKLFLKLEV